MASPVQECLELVMYAISWDQLQNLRNVLTYAQTENILRDLLQHRDPNGYTLIHFAVSKKKPRALEIVLAFALTHRLLRDVLLSLDNNGFTILHFAVFMGNSETVSILLVYAQSVGVLYQLRNVLGPGNLPIEYYARPNSEVLTVLNWPGFQCPAARSGTHVMTRPPRGS